MIKKLLLVAVIGGVAFMALKGTRFFGYAKQEIESAQGWLDSKIPVEKEIQRLKKEIESLDKDRVKLGNLLATEIVEVRLARENTEALRTSLKSEAEWLQAMAEEIREAAAETPAVKVKYNRETVNVAVAKDLLAADVTRHVAKKASLENQEKALAYREKNKDVLDQQFDVLKQQKIQLSAQVDAIEAEYQSLKLAQMESKYQTDTTRLSKIKESFRELEKKIAIEREKLKLAPRVFEGTTATSAAGRTVDEIMAPIDGKTVTNGKVTQK